MKTKGIRYLLAGGTAARLRQRCTGWLVASFLVVVAASPVFASDRVKVTITGLSGDPLTNVRASLGIAQQRGEDPLKPEEIQQFNEQAEQDIRRALQPFGYYKPQINSSLKPPDTSGSPWQASYDITKGDQVPIAAVDIQLNGPGANDPSLGSVKDSFNLGVPPRLDHLRYEKAKRELLTKTIAQGYLDADYDQHRVEVDLESYSARITLHIDTGPRYVYGPISFVQQDSDFSIRYLEKYLFLKPGEPFDHAEVSRQRTALSKSGHFQEVNIEPAEGADAMIASGTVKVMPLTVELTPYLANRYRGRLGWGTDTGFGLQADWNRRYLGSNGHSFNLGGTVVQERRRLAGEFRYIIPLDPLSGKRIEAGVRHESKDLTFEDVDLPEGGETRIATNLASAFWHFPVGNAASFEFRQRAGLSLVNETYDVFEVLFGSFSSSGQEAIIDRIGSEAYETLAPNFRAIVPSVRFTLRRSDDPLYIRRGDYYNLELLGADESLGSNISFLQARFNTWNIFPLGDHGRLLTRSALGYTDVESRSVLGVTFNQMPEYYEFRAGGARSIRGYGFETLFPSDGITGGKHQIVASVEYEHEIIPDWSAAVFVDGGNAFNDIDNIDEKVGVGFGLRWRSPVGLARIDIGFPLDEAEDSFQIYITVGPEF